jgi:twitching motility protein PilT
MTAADNDRWVAVETRLDAWLGVLHDLGGSDILLTDGSKPLLRVDGALRGLEAADPLTGEEIEAIARTQIDDQYGDRLHLGREVDFSFTWRDQDRIRASAFYQRSSCSLSLRRIPLRIPSLVQLGLPGQVGHLLSGRPGLILVTGQAGSGKSTTMAAMVEELNRSEPCHIVTIEDPIEFVYADQQAAVSQREVGTDTRSFATALRAVRREDPDVVMVGEITDPDTIAAVLELAETGHRVIAALGINDSVSCLERLIEVFPLSRRDQIRVQLAGTLLAVLYQRMVPRREGGLAAAYELMIGIPAVRKLIRDGRTAHLRQALVDGSAAGMQSLEQSLFALVEGGVVDLQTAVDASLYPQDLSSDAVMAAT